VAPPPRLGTLIDEVERDSADGDELEQLATASATATRLGELGDALLDHFVDRCRRSDHSWAEISAALGVSRQAAHKRFSATILPQQNGRLTPRAQTVLTAAADEARHRHHAAVGPEHLLLGLYQQPEGLAAQVLVELGAPDERVDEIINRLAPAGDTETASYEPMPNTRQTVETLRRTLGVALQLGHNYVGTEHILLALSEGDEDSLAVQALRECGITRDAVGTAVVARVTQIVRARNEREPT
jgi:hypothetical protein